MDIFYPSCGLHAFEFLHFLLSPLSLRFPNNFAQQTSYFSKDGFLCLLSYLTQVRLLLLYVQMRNICVCGAQVDREKELSTPEGLHLSLLFNWWKMVNKIASVEVSCGKIYDRGESRRRPVCVKADQSWDSARRSMYSRTKRSMIYSRSQILRFCFCHTFTQIKRVGIVKLHALR